MRITITYYITMYAGIATYNIRSFSKAISKIKLTFVNAIYV